MTRAEEYARLRAKGLTWAQVAREAGANLAAAYISGDARQREKVREAFRALGPTHAIERCLRLCPSMWAGTIDATPEILREIGVAV